MMPQPSVNILSYHLSQCTKEKALVYASCLHTYVCKSGLETHKAIGNLIVSMLVEIGQVFDAEKVFDRLVSKTECSWSSLINAYVKLGDSRHALTLYTRMRDDVHLSEFTLVALLNACAKLKDVDRGNELHSEIASKGLLKSNKFVGNALVDMYAKCGLVVKAQEVFDMLPARDVVTWTALVAGYAQHDHGQEALNCYQQMQLNGIHPNVVTYTCSLKACGSIAALEKGKEIHTQIEREGLLKTNSIVGNALVDMYAKCGLLTKAQEVFDTLAVRNVVSWNTLISGYVQHNLAKEALDCYEQMQFEGVTADAVTFTCSLKACAIMGAIAKGREMHTDIRRRGLLRTSQFVGNALVDMYAKCGVLEKAQELFDDLRVRHLVAWNALIVGYTQKNCGREALECFKQMQFEGVSPDAITVVCVIKACGSIGATEQGIEIHAHFEQKGLFERDPSLGSQLVDMYAKWGFLMKAQEEFDKLFFRDEVTWTALIAGYVQHDYGDEALSCFDQMQVEGVSPDAVTFACSLKACGSVGLAGKGQDIHAEVVRNGLWESENYLISALLDMYAKCGMLTQAQDVFDSISAHDVISWTALITAYAQQGEVKSVLWNFDRMKESISPNPITFVSVLNACSHAGLVDECQTYFEAMIKDYDIIPSFEHYTCIVDLFGRAGQLDKAVSIMKQNPFYNNIVMWRTLLGACRKWGDVELARQAYEQAVQLDEKEVASHVSMYNIYADAGLLEEAEKMNALSASKEADFSL